jgi:hypothetical protein
MTPAALRKRSLIWGIRIATLLVGGYLVSAMYGLWTPYTCITDTIQQMSNLSGYDFKVVETDCSTLGEDAAVKVYISFTGRKRAVLLFKYGPSGVNPYPSIAVPERDRVSISVPEVSDVFLERHKWLGISVDYHIGHAMQPDVHGTVTE